MTTCDVQLSGAVDLYFYGELPAAERLELERHLRACDECRTALEDLRTIRAALATRPDVSAPPGGDWSSFMARLQPAIDREPRVVAFVPPPAPDARVRRRQLAGHLAMAALLTLVTASVGYLALHRPGPVPDRAAASVRPPATSTASTRAGSPSATAGESDAAFAAVSEQHFERSKLVILGLANKDPKTTTPEDWAYERQLAGSLLDDTRLYKQAAEERGLGSLARVMSDLELVLLQTSLSEETDLATLNRLQRLIQKRDLVTRMEMTRF
jgi:hypothetical protein